MLPVFADSQSIENSLQQMKYVNNKQPRPDHPLDYQDKKFRQQFNHYHHRIKNTTGMMMMNFEMVRLLFLFNSFLPSYNETDTYFLLIVVYFFVHLISNLY